MRALTVNRSLTVRSFGRHARHVGVKQLGARSAGSIRGPLARVRSLDAAVNRRFLAVEAASASATPDVSVSAIQASARSLRESFFSHAKTAEIAAEADAPADEVRVVARVAEELRERDGDEEIDVLMLGEALTSSSERRRLSVATPCGPSGGPAVRKVAMNMPSVEDVKSLLDKRAEENFQMKGPKEINDFVEQFLSEKYYGRRDDHVAQIAVWGPKAIGDAQGEFAEIGALMRLSLDACKAAMDPAVSHFEANLPGRGKECLVIPPSNFAFLGLKDAVLMLLQGFRIVLVVQPRFFPHYREIQKDMEEIGLPKGMLDVMPGITPDADPAVLHEVLRRVDRLQFTGSSMMFQSLVAKAYDLGNLRLQHAGEVSGLNKVRLDGVSISHPAAAQGSAWAAMANNGELCTSASLLEFDPATGDTADKVKDVLEGQKFNLGRDPADSKLDILLKDGKTEALEVKTGVGAEGFREWWEKTVLAVPQGDSPPLVNTNQSLGHCIYSPTIARAVELGTAEDAACIYMVGVQEDTSLPSARAGTTGCKIPESVFGGMKTYTFAVAGDHDGVGSVQTILSSVKHRGASWKDNQEVRAEYIPTETAELLLDFLQPRDQKTFLQTVSNVLEVFEAFQPEVSLPYDGQPLSSGEGRSQLVTLQALRPARKNLFIPRGVGLPEDIVKVAVLHEMSPLREVPVDLHLMMPQAGKLRVTDPLKSFLRVVEKRLGWRLHWHEDMAGLTKYVDSSAYPPYFYCLKDKHMLPVDLLQAVNKQGGYMYEGFPTDVLSIFRMMTSSQAWTVSCVPSQVEEASAALRKAWQTVGLRQEAHEPPELVKPARRDDVGGGFGDLGYDPTDDKDWGELDGSDEDSEDEPEKENSGGSSEEAKASEKADAKDGKTS
mmetsp:Transcript_67237/g.161134  ORF Transcript_67237/g.161134 Transcript_67237/m.161134 type:complete len:890 (+) Transcript_67237:68-2737(+)